VNQVIRGLRLVVGRSRRRVENMEPYMSLDHFRHKGIHRTSAGGNIVQDVGTFGFLVQGSFNSINLAPDSPNAIQQLLLLFDCVSHNKYRRRTLQGYPGGYILVMGPRRVLNQNFEERRPIYV